MFNAQASIETPQSATITASQGQHDAVSVENIAGSGRFVVVCEHASNHVPPQFGMSTEDFSTVAAIFEADEPVTRVA